MLLVELVPWVVLPLARAVAALPPPPVRQVVGVAHPCHQPEPPHRSLSQQAVVAAATTSGRAALAATAGAAMAAVAGAQAKTARHRARAATAGRDTSGAMCCKRT